MSFELGKLYLIPNTLGKTPSNNTIPEHVLQIVRQLDVFFVEQIKSAQRFLQWVGDTVPPYEIEFYQLNKHTPPEELFDLCKPMLEGRNAGLLSEAGAPAVADPGAKMVKTAHSYDIPVVPLVGPSSILLGLMASGFNGQSFTFHGYLPRDKQKREQELRKLEQISRKQHQTQIFIETPHRNDELTESIINTCHPKTGFCRAVDLTLPSEQVESMKVEEWKAKGAEKIQKRPAIFMIYAGR
ncbi:MAG: SAM-dependent methyltransferase [Bacteroidota bacterium]